MTGINKAFIQGRYFSFICLSMFFILIVSLSSFNKRLNSPIAIEVSSYLDNRDGNSYEILKLDSLWWFNEDLLFETPGSKLPDSDKYQSRLYPFDESRIICPKGWRLPTVAEFDKLIEKLSGEEFSGLMKLPFDWQSINKNEVGIRLEKTNMFQKKKLVSSNSFNMWLADDSDNEAYHVHLYDVDRKDADENLSVFRHTHEEHNPIRNKRYMAVRCVCQQLEDDD